ncbi:Protease Do, partial [Operophtera brumata]
VLRSGGAVHKVMTLVCSENGASFGPCVSFGVKTRTATKQRWLGLRLCDESEDEMDEPSAAKRPSVLTIDRAAFLLLR